MQAPLSPVAAGPSSNAGSSATPPAERLVHLRIKSPSLPLSSSLSSSTLGAGALDSLAVAPHTTIAQVKRHIEAAWPGRPRAEGMRCIRAGRLMQDEETVEGMGGADPQDPASLHLVVRPDAWADPEASTLRPRLASRAPSVVTMRRQASSDATLLFEGTAVAAAAAAASSGTAASASSTAPTASPAGACDLTRLSDSLPAMTPATILRLATAFQAKSVRYGDSYATLWHGLYGAPSSPPPAPALPQVLQQLGVTQKEAFQDAHGCESVFLSLPEVEDNLKRALPQEWEDRICMAALSTRGADEQEKLAHLQQAVEVDGLPYLLRLPLTPRALMINELLHHLRFRIELLRDVSSRLFLYAAHREEISSAGAAGRDVPFEERLRGVPAAAAAATAAPAAAQAGGPVRMERRLLPALLLQELSAIAAPMLFLAFKLSILVYVFTRHAGDLKRWCIIGAATAYVFYEGLRIMQRRRRVRQREFAQRMMPGAAAAAQQEAPQTPQARQQPATQQRNEAGGALRAPQRHRATSPLTLAFWIEHLAYLSLADEDAELGLVPSAHAAPQPHQVQRSWRHKIYANVVLPAALFLGTLVPEVEIRRRRAIEEREELIRAEAAREEVRRRAKEAEREKKSREDDEKAAEASSATRSSAIPTSTPTATTTQTQPHQLLSSEYATRVLRRRGANAHGRQIDIQQELDAAAQQDDEEDEEPDDMDMGFF